MLWSLLKIVLFVALVTAAAFGVIAVMDQDGGLTVTLGGREYPFAPIEVLVLLVLAMIAFVVIQQLAGFLIALLRFITGDETALSRFFDRSRERRGFMALADAMMLNASGDGRGALAKARKADRLLDRPELTQLVTAQAAEEAGDRLAAEEQYKAMLGDQRTRFVGVHGLMRQRLAKGETETALKLAEKAFDLKPKHQGLQSTLFTLQAEQERWDGARRTLAQQVRTGALPKDVAQRRDAILNLAAAQDALAKDDYDTAKDAAVEAHRLAPGHVPAAVAVAKVHQHQNSPRAAQRALLKTWKLAPHPELAAAFAELESEETPSARRSRFDPFLKAQPEHAETRMLRAELAIADEDFPAARRAMGDLAQVEPTTRALAIMAAIERGEGAEDKVVRGWLAKALTAPRGPQWTCNTCRTVHPHWSAVCSNCDSFDTIDWLDLPESPTTQAAAGAMLPVVSGMLLDSAPEAEPEDEAEVVAEPEPEPAEPVVQPRDETVIDTVAAEDSTDLAGQEAMADRPREEAAKTA
ncbi:heme biosynthesis protein HemY [Pontivivens ytuae]|uniref:Heme biosynthesis protein HemY n=1 Tax=Pontivivens ytuae TaxID=2789856 RepID=A0A7S9LUQ1_9RHOB|nr:heme biosynthesis HemY N-terminal domain-containing protein [Pontivivens ytuae]QPH55345.1 heme biosynthesis protein HemY [Pontivivens ytuae]